MATATLPAGCFNPHSLLSFWPLPLEVFSRSDVSPNAKLLLTVLIWRCGKNNCAWPKVATLANDIGTSPRNISRLLKELESLGLIAVKSRKSLGTSNQYYFTDSIMENSVSEAELDHNCEVQLEIDKGVGQIRQEGRTDLSGGYDGSVGRVGRICQEKNYKRTSKEEPQNQPQTQPGANAPGSAHREVEISSGETGGIFSEFQKFAISEQKGLPLLDGDATMPAAAGWNLTVATMPTDEAKHNLRLQALTEAAAGAKAKYAETVKRKEEKAKKKRNFQGKATPVRLVKAMQRLEALWVKECSEKFPGIPLPKGWTYREKKPVRELFDQYGYPEEAISDAVVYFIRHWDKHRTRFSKTPSSFPTVGLFRAVHERVIPEAKVMSQALRVKAEYEAWCAQHRGELVSPPQDLWKAFEEAQKELKTVGL